MEAMTYQRRRAQRLPCHWRRGLVPVTALPATRDVDIAITPQTLRAFWDRTANDPRFGLHPDGHWVYACRGPGIEGLGVEELFQSCAG